MKHNYSLIDSGHGKKLEKWGDYLIMRPAMQALWEPQKNRELWQKADAIFTREGKEGWTFHKKIPSPWIVNVGNVQFHIFCSDFGHMGVFPEHASIGQHLQQVVKKGQNILNLFAYTGGATMMAAQLGAKVCHLDASYPMVQQAKENAFLNHLEKKPIRWIVDDVFKFLQREIKRKSTYDGIILDPPTFGRGKRKEVFKIERDLQKLFSLCKQLLCAKKDNFIIFTSHTPGFTPVVIDHLLQEHFYTKNSVIETKELVITSKEGFSLPSGSMGIWRR